MSWADGGAQLKNPMKVLTEEQLYNRCDVSQWLGYKIQKNPLDLMQYQKLLYDIRPDILVETGTFHGGSALYFATIMDALNHGVVITIDPWTWDLRPKHSRIYYMNDSAVKKEVIETVRQHAIQVIRVMVVLDSLHDKKHVLEELEAYAPMVTPGSYCVVEDTNIHGHGIRKDLPPGPWEAVHSWVKKHPEFAIDHNVEPPISNCPDGWLRRVKSESAVATLLRVVTNCR